jgi:hypothetical protein
MALRNGHGRGAGEPRIEVLPPDELPAPVASPSGPPAVSRAAPCGPIERRQHGYVADRQSAKALGLRGLQARAKKKADEAAAAEAAAQNALLLTALGLAKVAEGSEFAPYRAAGDEFVRHHLGALAAQGGGEVGPGPSSIVASAGLQLAASRFVSDRAAATGDPALFKQASQLANDSRQNLLAAYELAVREAAARPENGQLSPGMVWVDDEKGPRK